MRGVVLNGASEPRDLAEETNPASLARLLPVPIVSVTRRAEKDPFEVARFAAPLLSPLLD